MSASRLVQAFMRTDKGRVRNNNEDFIASREPDNAIDATRNGWLYLLADGAGGMDAGEVASRYATERTLHYYELYDKERDWGERLRNAMQAANRDLRQLDADVAGEVRRRMATTMVAAVIADEVAYIANVGDSRAYIWRNGELQQITKDQSLVAELVEKGAITPEEAATHPRRNVILFSLGSERAPRIDLFEVPLRMEDRLFLCSDGLTRHVSDGEIATVLGEEMPEEATRVLIDLANARGGQDNISVAVMRYLSSQEEARVVPGVAPEQLVSSWRWARPLLWLYTVLLSLVQSVIIVLLWLLLRL